MLYFIIGGIYTIAVMCHDSDAYFDFYNFVDFNCGNILLKQIIKLISTFAVITLSWILWPLDIIIGVMLRALVRKRR